jgi:protoheme IX farnesyltransferase
MNSKGQTASISAPAVSAGEVSDFLALLKPRVMFLVVFTALVGMVVVHPNVPSCARLRSLVMIAVGRGASGRAQHVVGRRYRRPHDPHGAASDPTGRIAPDEALAFGVALSVGSVVALGLIANPLAAFGSPSRSPSTSSSTRCG